MGRARGSARALALCFAAILLGASGGAHAASPTFRIEVHALPTITPTTPQLLAGTSAGAPAATIAGELRLPFSAAARLPAVVMLHGDAGAVANQVAWIDALNAIGVAVFTLDSFSGRGAIATQASLGSMPDSIGGAARVIDAERALAFLARHPRIDPARIAIMGFSSGGRTVLVAAQTRFASAYGTPGVGFAAYIALYPDCNVRLVGDTKTEPGPLRIFIGAADVLTSADTCARYVERLRRAGADATIVAYPGAHHGFDNVASPELTRIPTAPITALCNLDEIAPGVLVNVETGKPFAMNDACVGKGLIAGYDATAFSATRAAVQALLTERFRLDR